MYRNPLDLYKFVSSVDMTWTHIYKVYGMDLYRVNIEHDGYKFFVHIHWKPQELKPLN